MGYDVPTTALIHKARQKAGVTQRQNVTADAERRARQTGMLSPNVDPKVDVDRRSLLRFKPLDDGRFEVTVGLPVPIETSCDTTASMGHNVDLLMEHLPETYNLIAEMLPGQDPQLALGIFGDSFDKFVLQRPQFEMTSRALVNYLKDMAPGRHGQGYAGGAMYSMFAGAYLTRAYLHRIGLKGYHFVITDTEGREYFDADLVERIFGKEIYQKMPKDKFEGFSRESLRSLTIHDVFKALKRFAHPFMIFVWTESSQADLDFWVDVYGRDRVIEIETTEILPAVQAAIVGLTEGTLDVSEVSGYLSRYCQNCRGVTAAGLQKTALQLCQIPTYAQAELKAKLLEKGLKLPEKGDIFVQKTDLWPTEYHATSEEE